MSGTPSDQLAWELMGAPLGRIHVTGGPSTLGVGETIRVVPQSEVTNARLNERQRIVERLLHAANLLDSDDVSRTALTLEKMAMVLVTERYGSDASDEGQPR